MKQADRASQNVPIQPVDRPILCSPYAEPNDHWQYDAQTGVPSHGGMRRPAGYWYKDRDRTGARQLRLLTEEHRDDLPLVNFLRDDVRRWRESGYRGATPVTRELLQHWARLDLKRRLFSVVARFGLISATVIDLDDFLSQASPATIPPLDK